MLLSKETNTRMVPPLERWMFFPKEKEPAGQKGGAGCWMEKKQVMDNVGSSAHLEHQEGASKAK